MKQVKKSPKIPISIIIIASACLIFGVAFAVDSRFTQVIMSLVGSLVLIIGAVMWFVEAIKKKKR